MNRIFLAVASIICTHFVMKVHDKLTQEPPSKEEIHRLMNTIGTVGDLEPVMGGY